jgi:hypothetical protein
MTELRASGNMFRVDGWDAIWTSGPGAFFFSKVHDGDLDDGTPYIYETLVVRLPMNVDGGSDLAILPLKPARPRKTPDTAWEFDGNREKPTLTPSVHCHGHWHGFIRAGRYESC